MKTAKKLLVIFFVAVILTFTYDGIAFASNLPGTLPEQETFTEEANKSQGDLEIPSDDVHIEDTLIEEDLLIEDDMEFDEEVEEEIEEIEETIEKEVVAEQKKEKKEAAVKKPSYSEKDLRLLSCLVYAEAGNQSYKGMLAVANVVINRAKSDVYWHVKTIEEVIYDNKWSVQFAVTVKNKKSGVSILDNALKAYDTGKFTGSNSEAAKKAMQNAVKAAKAALQGENNIGDYLCFQNKRYSSSIKKKYSSYKIIGDHIFYRTK